MKNIFIAYYSNTGNTEKMAELIKKGAESAGANVTCKEVTDASENDIINADVIALGCPSAGAEELSDEMDSFVNTIKDKLSGKKVALFGSYDWGDGEWMRNWVEAMEATGATVVGGEDAIAQLEPDDEQVFISLGESLAK